LSYSYETKSTGTSTYENKQQDVRNAGFDFAKFDVGKFDVFGDVYSYETKNTGSYTYETKN
jgi:hypothetical protein